jgi:curved DNA-binding protein CbpA
LVLKSNPEDADTLTLDIEPVKPREENIFATDYYEILRVGPQADEDTIERVYGTLADRFHPDNPSTGDPETFLRLREAYETLSNPAKRANYNVVRQGSNGSARFWLRGYEFFDGVRGGQNRRLAVLCLLYRRRISTHESPGLTILELERLTGCTREELTYALWYLCEKKWSTLGEFTAYSITADGFDFVESKLEDRLEFRALATLSYYSLPAEVEDSARVDPRFWIDDTLSLDTDSTTVTDHYEILGIGPQADEESIERVYHTLAGRFQSDNPSTGEAKALLRIREAYDTLSDQARRAQYNARRQRTKDSTRFRLRGREFFDGIKGEQLRRLVVLCLLYRQAAGESRGLTVLDLERLTGCTREELGSALWYLREKKWAKSGEFTEYSITAAGFDVVENKVEDREAARSRVWVSPEPPSDELVAAAAPRPAQLSGVVIPMNISTKAIAEQAGGVAVSARKRVVFSMGGKGGVGKTSVMTGLAEWFEENRIPVTMLDLDIENKAKGSLTHFFGGRVPKINIHTPAGLDAFVDILAADAPAILADMGSGAGQITHDWFHKMYPDVTEAGVVFTAVGVVTSDPASVESVLNWGAALEDRVAYVIVENNLSEHSDFTYWRENDQAEEFRKRFQPAILRIDYRLADLENAVRNFGVTLGQVAGRTAPGAELQKASLVMRAQSYRRRMFAEFDTVKELLLP